SRPPARCARHTRCSGRGARRTCGRRAWPRWRSWPSAGRRSSRSWRRAGRSSKPSGRTRRRRRRRWPTPATPWAGSTSCSWAARAEVSRLDAFDQLVTALAAAEAAVGGARGGVTVREAELAKATASATRVREGVAAKERELAAQQALSQCVGNLTAARQKVYA